MHRAMRAGAPVLALGLGMASALGLAPRAGAQVDPGAPDGGRQTVHTVRAFDRYGLPVGPFGLDAPAVREIEGAVDWSAYELNAPDATVAGVLQGYRERLQALGFEPLFECAGEACGGFDFRFGAEILAPPGMLLDVRDFAQLSVARDAAAGPAAHVSVLVSRVLESIYVQTVSVAPSVQPEAAAQLTQPADPAEQAGPAEAPAEVGEAPPAELPLGAETPPDAQPPAAVGPEAEGTLRARLMRDGHVPVQGLDFEVGGVRLSPGSAAALDGLARMLTAEGTPSVIVVGHSDNQGALDLNLDISRRRAEQVRQALIERGVPADRLDARGVGFLAPVASNATEAGRAVNRRVELVLR